ncbi:dTDP-4-dehydrorhamnose reductase [Pandoraea nosoerga]|uniref:dTDP-4-dehydrorhamnose reductase n=1 Tax=Pandoraea nosoerga TaxID=2508296 RepID=A0A5E4VLQ4_9BURK|nr:dTDP-4-dehydrorhamnose reductase [Pandoraea nosoerga]MBN4665149.1 dTDP-4-dehydrorhamnose reductase [Pandoraea nosoerga]MBN4677958.1 dTDP-4-dehydrorhamnose reductase [Pandoraea nosoerga]MBN4683175.1 dTDP-4-dehydrorhamnose reductase [Pandoraea nosoerga]MBN4747121.1 dTDP-4-dehydrorhamnose reductase [Pandoraea nosoerga]VVE11930.1 dTDP-4-dehydrorhamnose reductase [Pandoraea nosoerga]
MARRILLTGATGQVGWELARCLQGMGDVHAPSRAEMDLLDTDSVVRTVRDFAPDLIINPAAYTAVDRAETEEAAAHQVNAIVPGVMAEEAARRGALMVHYSTDYVFDGTSRTPYREDDPTHPQNAYGRTKLAGEAAIAASGANHLVLRTSWVYGSRGANFLLTVQRLARERDELRIVADQYGAPTWCRTIAELTSQVLAQGLTEQGVDTDFWREHGGLYHLSAGGQTTWHGFTEAILERSATQKRPSVVAIPTSAYPLPAKRPAYSVLDNDKLARTFGVRAPDWRDALTLCLA